jgi:hypothetical protein
LVRVWLELPDEQSGWGPTRQVVARLRRNGYNAEELMGAGPKTLVILGNKVDTATVLSIGPPPRAAR